MANSNPSPDTRWQPGQSGFRGGRTPRTRWIRTILNEKDDAGHPLREQILRHLIEVATRWEVIVLGRNMEVASGRDSVEAAKLVMAYDLGKPREMETAKVSIPDGCDTSRSLLDIVADVYRSRLVGGQMGESEFAEMARLMLSVDQVKLALLLKLLGKDTSGKTPDQVLAMLNDHHETAAQIADSSPVDMGDSGGTNASQHGSAGSGESAAENPVPPGEPSEGSKQG